MPVISVKSNIRNYTVSFGNANIFLNRIEKKYPQVSYVVDKNIWILYRKTILAGIDKKKVIVLDADEKIKNLRTVQRLYDCLIRRDAKRNMTVVTIGGGILQDVTGFLVSTLYRGIGWIFIPTTLLAQADSCIGSKTSLNYKNFKNLIGTFYPPHEVFIDCNFLATLKPVDFYSGLGEIVKLHISGGPSKVRGILNIFTRLTAMEKTASEKAIYDSLLIKRGYIQGDEFDNQRRNLLNYGHCFGHAIETVGNFQVPHGQAVVLGMILANIIARRRGVLSGKQEEFLSEKLLLPSIAIKPKEEALSPTRIISAMRKDKKRKGKGLALVLLKNKNRLEKVNDLNETEVKYAISEFTKRYF
ncbi:MAG: hypothetical protein COS29_04735 [Candidatus Omnitrophica bacterium CG02_land_8_20_14_3_00__42_8]|nr:MAG: hypothetical protein COS29_04735 [Candidatus Omnitrophica bacterium CG02_land_8_20_14_3_00__42_8]